MRPKRPLKSSEEDGGMKRQRECSIGKSILTDLSEEGR